MISRIIGSGEKWSILFFKDIPGFYFPLSVETLKGFDKIEKTGIPEELLSKTYLSISLTDIIANFLVDGMDGLTGGLRPGDMFNFVDSGNSNHHKIYKVVRVADSTNKISTDTALNTSDERRLYVVPPVEKDVTDNST